MNTEKKDLKCSCIITSLSIAALVCSVLNIITYYFIRPSISNDGFGLLTINFGFPVIKSIPFILLQLLPYILFIVYITKFYYKDKAKLIFPAFFAILAITPLFETLLDIVLLNMPLNFYIKFDKETLIYNSLTFLIFAWAFINSLWGLTKKVGFIVPLALGMLVQLTPIQSVIAQFDVFITHGRFLFLDSPRQIICTIFSILSTILLYIGLLIFGLKNNPSYVLLEKKLKETRDLSTMPPDKALKYLKECFELEIITEEEYQAQRAEIISKL